MSLEVVNVSAAGPVAGPAFAAQTALPPTAPESALFQQLVEEKAASESGGAPDASSDQDDAQTSTPDKREPAQPSTAPAVSNQVKRLTKTIAVSSRSVGVAKAVTEVCDLPLAPPPGMFSVGASPPVSLDASDVVEEISASAEDRPTHDALDTAVASVVPVVPPPSRVFNVAETPPQGASVAPVVDAEASENVGPDDSALQNSSSAPTVIQPRTTKSNSGDTSTQEDAPRDPTTTMVVDAPAFVLSHWPFQTADTRTAAASNRTSEPREAAPPPIVTATADGTQPRSAASVSADAAAGNQSSAVLEQFDVVPAPVIEADGDKVADSGAAEAVPPPASVPPSPMGMVPPTSVTTTQGIDGDHARRAYLTLAGTLIEVVPASSPAITADSVDVPPSAPLTLAQLAGLSSLQTSVAALDQVPTGTAHALTQIDPALLAVDTTDTNAPSFASLASAAAYRLVAAQADPSNAASVHADPTTDAMAALRAALQMPSSHTVVDALTAVRTPAVPLLDLPNSALTDFARNASYGGQRLVTPDLVVGARSARSDALLASRDEATFVASMQTPMDSQNSSPAPTAAPAVVQIPNQDQAAASIVQAIKLQWTNPAAGAGRAVVNLDPAYLGEVRIALQVGQGVVTATIHAANADVRAWLQINESGLRQGLAIQGLTLDRLVVLDETSTDDREPPDGRRRQPEPEEETRRAPRRAPTGTFNVVV